jgi:sugar phosphate isomerase/epimerase
MNYIISAFADEAADSLTGQIAACKKNNIRYIEMRGVNGRNISTFTAAEAVEIKKALDAEGVGVSALGSPYGKMNIKEDFAPHLEKYKRTIEVAHILGTKNIRMFSFFMPENENPADYRSQVTERVGAFVEHADGILPCLENESHLYGVNAERCLELLQAFGGRLRLAFDPANFLANNIQTRPAYEMLKPHIEYFHIKDYLKSEGKTVPAGYGDGDIPWILEDFAASYSGDVFLSIEPHLSHFTGLDELSQKTAAQMKFSYRSREEAFDAAAEALRRIVNQ